MKAKIFDYVVPAGGVSAMVFLVSFYLMKYATDVLLVAPAVMGTIFLVGRIWDAVTDPMVGYLSDRSRSRLGRRRPWLLVSIVPLAATFIICWSPPGFLSGDSLTCWMAIAIIAFFSSATLFSVPHLSMGAELSDNYHDRTRIFGLRHVADFVGAFLAIGGLGLLISASESDSRYNPRAVAFGISLVLASLAAGSILWTFVRVHERLEYQDRSVKNLYQAYRDVFSNKHFRPLFMVAVLNRLGVSIIASLAPYVTHYIVKLQHLLVYFMVINFISAIAFVPLCLRLSKHLGKKKTLILAMLLKALIFLSMFSLDEGAVVLLCVLAVLIGLAASFSYTLTPSLMADVIDFDEYQSGQRKEGSYYSIWTFIDKTSIGLAAMLTGYVLQLSGFIPNQELTETARLLMLVLFSLVPCILQIIGVVVFWRFSLNEVEHQKIRVALNDRKNTAEPRIAQEPTSLN